MNQKVEKKMRKLFRNQIREKLDTLTSEAFTKAPVFKNKPSWCPQWLWSKLVAFILDDSFVIKYELEKAKFENNRASESDEVVGE